MITLMYPVCIYGFLVTQIGTVKIENRCFEATTVKRRGTEQMCLDGAELHQPVTRGDKYECE